VTSPRLTIPPSDPVGLFELFNANYGNKILAAATSHLNVFLHLRDGFLSGEELKRRLGISERGLIVLTTALRAFGLMERDSSGRFGLSEYGETFAVPGVPFDVSDYFDLAAEARGVNHLVEQLRNSRPEGDTPDGRGAAYIKRDGVKSAMDDPVKARWLTERLAGRAANTAALLADRVPIEGARFLLDIGGGTGIFCAAYLQKYPELRAEIFELPTVARVAVEYAEKYGVGDRVRARIGDMFSDPFPEEGVDVILLSNILHDWDVPLCRQLVKRCARALKPGGKLIIHDVLLNDELDGPYHIAIYSVVLFSVTEGRAYSAAEYRQWLSEAGLVPQEVVPTFVHCSALTAVKPKH
jgi:SAM-dependent methyltransferase